IPREQGNALILIRREGLRVFDQMQRRLWRIMRRQLPGRVNLLRGSDDVDVSEGRQLLARNWAAPQDVDLAVAHHDDGRFDPVWSCARINNERNATVELIENVLGGGGTHAAETIRAWRSQRPAECA